jgi:hypothetical protein
MLEEFLFFYEFGEIVVALLEVEQGLAGFVRVAAVFQQILLVSLHRHHFVKRVSRFALWQQTKT